MIAWYDTAAASHYSPSQHSDAAGWHLSTTMTPSEYERQYGETYPHYDNSAEPQEPLATESEDETAQGGAGDDRAQPVRWLASRILLPIAKQSHVNERLGRYPSGFL